MGIEQMGRDGRKNVTRVMARGALLALTLAAAACGGGSSGPTPLPSPPTPPGQPVSVVVFEDTDGDGLPAGDPVRLPGVAVTIGSRRGVTGSDGRVVVENVPAGPQAVTVDTATLPPYYVPGTPVSITVPVTAEVPLPVRLPIGTNHPHVYMPYGDSITKGLGSSDGTGYRSALESHLISYFGAATFVAQPIDGGTTGNGVTSLDKSLRRVSPALVLLMMGTNDWNLPECQDKVPCSTIDNLRTIVRNCKANGSLVVLATIPPANPAVNAGRNTWVEGTNTYIKQMGAQEGVVVADVYAAFQAHGNLPSLFAPPPLDDVHPNDAGYAIIEEAFFQAVTRGKVGG